MVFYIKIFFKYIFLIILVVSSFSVYASETNGTIDATYYSALLCANADCTTSSQINFLTTNGTNVVITDSAITGKIWSENMGWINLNPANGGVVNTEEGGLSGYAWGENTGWINFSPTNGGVSINTDGEFVGYAWAQNAGWIKFDCAVVNACVKTDWRPLSVRPRISSGSLSHTQTPPSPPLVINFPVPPISPPTPFLPPTQPPITFPDDSQNENSPSKDNNFSNRELDFSSTLEEIEYYLSTYQDNLFFDSDLEESNEENSNINTTFSQTKTSFYTYLNDIIINILNKIISFCVFIFNYFLSFVNSFL